MAQLISNTDALITMLNILDEFPEFNQEIERLAKKYSMAEITHHLIHATKGDNSPFLRRKIYQFYNDNKELIDRINKDYDIFMFINDIYQRDGTLKKGIAGYYDYFLREQDKKEDMKSLLEKIKSLDIEKVILDSSLDFKGQTYKLEDWYKVTPISSLSYLENIEIIPNYEDSTIKYTTQNSNYEITLPSDTSFGNSVIKVKNLAFPKEALPDTITFSEVFEKVNNLAKNNKDQKKALQETIELNVAAEDLNAAFHDSSETFTSILGASNKEELQEALKQISSGIKRLYKIGQDFQATATIENPSLSYDLIDRETKEYIKRREESIYDLD